MIRLASVMLIIVFCFCPSLAQVKFDHLSIREGISNNSVRDIKQDETGFLWFATLNGVTRFDGNGFRYFLYDSENQSSISSNRILQIYPDKKGQIWLISYDRKVNLYNRESNTFSELPFTVQRPVYYKEFNFVFESSPGVIWFVDSSFALQRCRINPNKNIGQAELVNDSYQPWASVNCIRSDSCGALWIGTTNGLIYFPSDTIDFSSDKIRHLLKGKHISVTDITDNNDELLIGTDSQGFMSLNKTDFIISKSNISQAISHSHIWNIRMNNRGQCLITTVHDGFVFYDQVANYSRHFNERETRWPLSDYLTTYVDHYGHFWLVSKKNGVVRVDCGNGEILPFHLEAQLRASVVDEERLVIKEDSNLDLWIGTYGSGLFRFIKEQKRFEHYVHQKNNPASLSSNFILSLCEDRSKNLWIGTRNGGLNKLSLAKTKFQQITPFENPVFDHQNEVRAMVTDSNGNIWVGTKTGEILVYDAQFRLLANLNKMAPLKGKIPTIGIYVLFFDHEGKLWVGTKGEGIFLIEGLTGKSGFDDLSKMQITRIHRGTHRELSSDFVYSIIEDPKEQIWVGTYMGGLYRFRKNESGYQADRFVSQSGDSIGLPDNKIRQLNIDSKGNLWISTTNGLALISHAELDRPKPSITRINNRTETGYSISYNDILFLHQSSDGEYWAGTYGGGLNRLTAFNPDFTGFKWERVDLGPMVANHVVYSIVSDHKGFVWLTTDLGILKYDRATGRSEQFHASDIIPGQTFSEAGCLITRKNELAFSHTNGFVFFHPDSITVDSVHFPLVLTSFYLYNEKIESGPNPFFDGPIEDVREITLAHNQNYIGFEFSVLDYRSASKISYAYILENYDQNWNFSGSQNRAFYKNLKPGKYVFKVKSTNYSGIWNETPRTIRITVRKPFWQSDRAMVLYFFLLFGLSGLTYYLAAKRIRQKIDLATEKRLNLKKMWFYAAVSHEFKSPLTLLLGMVDRLIANTRQNNEVQSRLKIIKQNALRLLHLLEEMVDYRKVQNGILKENRQNTELVGFFYEFYEAFREYAVMRNVSFEFTTNLSHFKAEIDREHMERIILNLLTSVFKFSTPDRGVRLSLNIEPEKLAFFVAIRFVLNDIEKESIFAEPKDSYVEPGVFDSGNPGISMALCKELISLLNGKVEMTCNKNHEINFTVEFPLFPSMGKESLPVLKWLPDTTTWMKGELTDGASKAKGQSARIYGTILVVDDHDAFRLFMAESLKNKYQVWEAAEGLSALELARKQLPDLILCDLEMPGMNGIDLIGKLKSSHLTSHIPVVVLSAYSSDEHKMESLGVGADGFITKPFNMEFLIGTIDNIIRQRKILREHYNFQTNAHQEKKPASDPSRSFIQKTIECIEAHLSDQNFSVDELAEVLGYSRSVFYQKVKAAAGKTPNDLIKSIRMKKAAEMLRTSNKTISQIASEVGFSDMAYFRKCFRDVYGENPSAYHGKYE